MGGEREGLRRFAAPAALLVLVTIAVVLIHNGLSKGSASSTAPPTATAPSAASSPTTAPAVTTPTTAATTAPANAEYYVVQSGDTFGSIAARYGTSVTAIESLNPGVSSTSLTVGEKIRVK